MFRTKLVIVFVCLVNFAELRRLYYPNRNDPNAIVFEGPTNYDTRKVSENEVEDILDVVDVRFDKLGGPDEVTLKPPEVPCDGGFFFPDD